MRNHRRSGERARRGGKERRRGRKGTDEGLKEQNYPQSSPTDPDICNNTEEAAEDPDPIYKGGVMGGVWGGLGGFSGVISSS